MPRNDKKWVIFKRCWHLEHWDIDIWIVVREGSFQGWDQKGNIWEGEGDEFGVSIGNLSQWWCDRFHEENFEGGGWKD